MHKGLSPAINKITINFFHALISAFRILWVAIGGGLIARSLWTIASTGQPLEVNEEPTAWMGTVGFIALLTLMVLVGWFCPSSSLRRIKKVRAALEQTPE